MSLREFSKRGDPPPHWMGRRHFLKEQALTVEEAISTYTAMGAEASFEEQGKGDAVSGKASGLSPCWNGTSGRAHPTE